MAESKRLAAHRAGAPAVSAEETNPDVLLAGFNEEQMKAITAHFASKAEDEPKAEGSEDGNDDGMKCTKCSEPMKDGKCSKCSTAASADAAASVDPVAAARADERNRFTAVMSSEHYKGREALAATLLANDKLSADDIVTALASANASTTESGADAEAGAVMLNAMKAFGNPDTADSGQGQQQEADHGWGKIHAEIRERRGR